LFYRESILQSPGISSLLENNLLLAVMQKVVEFSMSGFGINERHESLLMVFVNNGLDS